METLAAVNANTRRVADNARNYATIFFFFFQHRWTAFLLAVTFMQKTSFLNFLCKRLLLCNADVAAVFTGAVPPPRPFSIPSSTASELQWPALSRHTADLSLLVGLCVCHPSTCNIVQHKKTHSTEFIAWLMKGVIFIQSSDVSSYPG